MRNDTISLTSQIAGSNSRPSWKTLYGQIYEMHYPIHCMYSTQTITLLSVWMIWSWTRLF